MSFEQQWLQFANSFQSSGIYTKLNGHICFSLLLNLNHDRQQPPCLLQQLNMAWHTHMDQQNTDQRAWHQYQCAAVSEIRFSLHFAQLTWDDFQMWKAVSWNVCNEMWYKHLCSLEDKPFQLCWSWDSCSATMVKILLSFCTYLHISIRLSLMTSIILTFLLKFTIPGGN